MDIIDKMYCYYKNCDLEKGYIGRTECGRKIPYIFVGEKTKPIIIAQYSLHAREYITTALCLKQIEYLSAKRLNFGVYFLPMVNIDGVDLAVNNLKNIPKAKHAFLLEINESEDFSKFKANANGVDLNVNFDADWGSGLSNINYPFSENYIGEKPFSERETKALRDFTLKIKPQMTVSFHSKGEEIYWFYGQKEEKDRDFFLADIISKSNGYSLKYSFGSAGGYKDWCIQKLKIPSFTIEVGNDNLSHPIREKYTNSIFNKNRTIFENLVNAYKVLDN